MSEFGNMALFWTLLGTQSFGATLCILNSPSLGLAFPLQTRFPRPIFQTERFAVRSFWGSSCASRNPFCGVWVILQGTGCLDEVYEGLWWSRWSRWQVVTRLQLFVNACIYKNDFAYSPDPFFNTQSYLAGKFLALYTIHHILQCMLHAFS